MASKTSPFLHPGPVSSVDRLSIVHLKRDLQIPTILKEHDDDDEGYSEGKVVNTRFGSFPHSTLIGLHWGTQVRASKVDTGSRGRRVRGAEKKRKRDESGAADTTKKQKLDEAENGDDASIPTATKEEKEAVAASSGFIHLLPPTPENWTSSLPHRTQVVYTPDYSYILHRLRARPGTSIIEAGAGSGSFTHASARAVYSGYPGTGEVNASPKKKRKLGKVWSYEFHEQRHEKLVKEIEDHKLEEIVQITHRDVCENGFLVNGQSPGAEAVFLDLPAPWLALPHLSRSKPGKSKSSTPVYDVPNGVVDFQSIEQPFFSPLNHTASVYLCTFSPCIEQVQRTVSVMRQLGWVDIDMVEIAAKRFEIRRERVGIDNGAHHGLQVTPASVDEAVSRLIAVEGTFKNFHETGEKMESKSKKINPNSKEKILESLVERKVYKEGKLVHRAESEVKTHTSYLVFAVLPRDWNADDEVRAMAKWPILPKADEDEGKEEVIGMSRRQAKKLEKQASKERREKAEKEATKQNLERLPDASEANNVAGTEM